MQTLKRPVDGIHTRRFDTVAQDRDDFLVEHFLQHQDDGVQRDPTDFTWIELVHAVLEGISCVQAIYISGSHSTSSASSLLGTCLGDPHRRQHLAVTDRIVNDLSAKPKANYVIYIWQCNRALGRIRGNDDFDFIFVRFVESFHLFIEGNIGVNGASGISCSSHVKIVDALGDGDNLIHTWYKNENRCSWISNSFGNVSCQ
mmetsp:Transcript_6393/g.15033  ORF Transcript_6393/g.15033 Transcript_6393/m.15033 type:complete len:201 (+) Transcript_6393:3337-3939(+)